MKFTDEENDTREVKENDVVFKDILPEGTHKREYHTSPVGGDENEKEQSVKDNKSDSNDGDEDKKPEREGVNEGGRMKKSDEQLILSSFIITISPSPCKFSPNVILTLFSSCNDNK
jgi:hypothetical protein